MTQSSDDRLRIEAAQLDPSRFGELYEEHFYRVYAYIARRVGNRHLAEDLTADVFREALAGIKRFAWRGIPFAAWLLRIASRMIADHFQRSGQPSLLVEVAEQVERLNRNVGPVQRSLQKAPEIFTAVRMAFAIYVCYRVVDCLVLKLIQTLIRFQRIGKDRRPGKHMLSDFAL